MPVERENLYIIPPGTYLAISGGVLHLSKPVVRHGSRLPVDFFLNSLAEALGSRAVAIILSGTGADGSLGLQAISRRGGFVIA
jgi:two-component system CheB/CheR fusion protein